MDCMLSEDDSEKVLCDTYVNACQINSLVRETDPAKLKHEGDKLAEGAGKGSQTAFLACQSPTDEAVPNFWQMIFEANVKTVVMLCPCMGARKVESNAYWEETLQQESARVYVSKVGSEKEVMPGLIKRTLTLKQRAMSQEDEEEKNESMKISSSEGSCYQNSQIAQPYDQEEKKIYHYQMTSWVDD